MNCLFTYVSYIIFGKVQFIFIVMKFFFTIICSDEAILFKIEDGVVNEEINCIQQVQDHDLKGAATLFTLTNCTS